MEEPEVLTNSARRLHAILVRSKAYANGNTRTALASTFGVSQENYAAIYSKFAAFLRLVETVEIRFRSLQHKHSSHYIKAIEALKVALGSVNLDQPWNSYISRISESDLALLALAGDFLDDFREEALIDKAVIEQIRKEAQELRTNILAGAVDEHLKVILLDLLDSMLSTISDYQIRGSEGLKRSLAECIGMVIIERPSFEKERENVFVRRFWDVLSKLNTAVRSAQLAYALGDTVGPIIAQLVN